MRTHAIVIAAQILAASFMLGCTDTTSTDLRGQLDEPTAFTLMPYVSMAELGVDIDGVAFTSELAIERGDATMFIDAGGELVVSSLNVVFAPVLIDDQRSVRDLRVSVAPDTRCTTTEWAGDEQSCFGDASAQLSFSAADAAGSTPGDAPIELMVSASAFEGAPIMDLMAGERPQLSLWQDVELTSITLVLHGVVR